MAKRAKSTGEQKPSKALFDFLEQLEKQYEIRKRAEIQSLYNRFIEVIEDEKPSWHHLLFVLKLLEWNLMSEAYATLILGQKPEKVEKKSSDGDEKSGER